MIPLILAAVGGYLIGNSMTKKVTMANGGITDYDMLEASEIMGEEKWQKLSLQERIDFVNYLKKDELMGMEEPIDIYEVISHHSFKDGGSIKTDL
jgi:hypothetical protein